MTAQKSVLVIGFDPRGLDFTTPERAAAGLTADKVLAGIKAEQERIRALGYDLHDCLINQDASAEGAVLQHLKAGPYDCVLIGAGVRTSPDALLLFEKIVNLVHEHAPRARICFSTTPRDSADAIRRWV